MSTTPETPVTAVGDAVGQATGQWTLDPNGSSASISHSTLWGLVKVKGRFSGLRGEGQVGADGAVTGVVAVDAASIDTKNKKRDDHLRSDDFFKVEANPEIIFEARSARPDGPGFLVDGVLTAGGVSRRVEVPVAIVDVRDDAITVEASVEVDRADHGMSFNQMGMIRGRANARVVGRFVRSEGNPR